MQNFFIYIAYVYDLQYTSVTDEPSGLVRLHEQGAFIMGLGYMLTEEFQFDNENPNHGRNTTIGTIITFTHYSEITCVESSTAAYTG